MPATNPIRLKRRICSLNRRIREARMIATALKSRYHPILAHLVPMRRCNLSCTYCNEYDDFSKPVPTALVQRRLELLAALGTSAVTLSGGEPLLHPGLDEMIRCIRRQGMLAELITNGYLLTPERIRKLNDAGLDHLQISIDNVVPDEVSKKSLKVLDRKLQWLAENAEFEVNINSVLGSSIRHPEDALTIAGRARELGFQSTVGLIHDGWGQLRKLDHHQGAVFQAMSNLDRHRRRVSPTLEPERYGCAFLANQVSDYPMLLANLEIFHSESNQFSPSQAASDEQCQNRPITLASETV